MNLTLEQIQAQIDNSEANLVSLRSQYDAINKALKAETSLRNKLEKQKTKLVGTTFETAFPAFMPYGGENTIGCNWFEHKKTKGSWKGLGLAISGYWPETRQYALQVTADHNWSDEHIDQIEAAIEEAMPFVKAGAAGEGDLHFDFNRKGESVPLDTLKVISIFDRELSENHNWMLAETADERWVIYDARTVSYWGSVRTVGTLRDCLVEIRDNLYYSGGPEKTEYEYD